MDPLLLLHSPLVGPSTWSLVAPRLRSYGYTVGTPSLAGGFDDEPPYYPALAARALSGPESPGVLVVHSGAGALVPSIASALSSPLRVVYVDALLPHPGRPWFDTAPPALADHLRSLADSGVLPPWDEWFPPGALTEILPEQGIHDRFRAELPRLPLAYFSEVAPVPESAEAGFCAYLRLSTAYDTEASSAEARGWPVIRREADHLAMLTRPDEVAADVHELVRRLG